MSPQAFEALVTVHHPEIHRYLSRISARSSEADDLSQETFIRAYRAYQALPEDANVRAWLFAVPTAPAWLQRAGLGADGMGTGARSGGALDVDYPLNCRRPATCACRSW